MELWAIVEPGKPLQKIHEEDPVPAGSEVLVRVTHCGVCHSDLHLWKGEYDLGGGKKLNILERGVSLPRAPGHEVLGEVVAVGPDAEGVKVGDTRVIYPWMGCGECAVCKRGDENMCDKPHAVGVIHHGGFGSHVLLPHPRYLFDYGNVDPAVAVTFACSGITVYSAIAKMGDMPKDSMILLIGAGGLGFAALTMLQALGYSNIIMSDISESKRDAALEAGAIGFVLSGPDMIDEVHKIAGGAPAACIDLVNNGKTTQVGLDVLGRGGKLVLVGVGGGEIPLSTAGMIFKPRQIIGSATGSLHDLAAVIKLANDGKLPPVPVNRMPKDQANEAIDKLEHGQVTGRIILTS
ncbi:alcohol dehydrogenase [Seohaeicola zhoushanensis]|uniref:alcohol dehydrogenase n=1 Tax=Seohaeicola zhoushanensis TaxID=1569283 RepID=A0A8J3H0C4_9RHOB|nr:alcohol dehydrogenase [Seohaeicola zhoushanensis]GHF67175.1 NAD-dependent alcohol dehydrogenase [Seohaeicola zhoushanensis]